MYQLPKLIEGDLFRDDRGVLAFHNFFNMQAVKRMYIIQPASCKVVRAWQAHKDEKKWFLCIAGAFEVKLIQVDDFNNPSREIPATSYILQSDIPAVLSIPGGYANGFKALEEGSKLVVFSNYDLNESLTDDYRFDPHYWNVWAN